MCVIPVFLIEDRPRASRGGRSTERDPQQMMTTWPHAPFHRYIHARVCNAPKTWKLRSRSNGDRTPRNSSFCRNSCDRCVCDQLRSQIASDRWCTRLGYKRQALKIVSLQLRNHESLSGFLQTQGAPKERRRGRAEKRLSKKGVFGESVSSLLP